MKIPKVSGDQPQNNIMEAAGYNNHHHPPPLRIVTNRIDNNKDDLLVNKDDLKKSPGSQDSGRHYGSTQESMKDKDTLVSDAPRNQEHLPPLSPPRMVGVKVSACRDRHDVCEVSKPVVDMTRADGSGDQLNSNECEQGIPIVKNVKRDITVRGVSYYEE